MAVILDCNECQGVGGHSTWEGDELVTHNCTECEGTGQRLMKTVEHLDKLALERYETGGDVFIECWESHEKQALLDKHGYNALGYVMMLMDNWHDRAEGIRNTAF